MKIHDPPGQGVGTTVLTLLTRILLLSLCCRLGPNLIGAMGVYVVIHTTRPWIKIGHHKVTARRPALDHRLRRGFKSCKHPAELAGRLEKSHFRIVAWFPTLGLLDERRAHLICSASVGEFHPARNLPRVLRTLDERSESGL